MSFSSSSPTKPPWLERIQQGDNCTVQEWNDGHVPETLPPETPTKIVRYAQQDHNDPPTIGVYQDVVSPLVMQQIYHVTTTPTPTPTPEKKEKNKTNHSCGSEKGKKEGSAAATLTTTTGRTPKPWGTYVTVEEALQARQRGQSEENNHEDEDNHNENDESVFQRRRHELAVQVVSQFLLRCDLAKHCVYSRGRPLDEEASLLDKAHGVAVWALASLPGAQVSYHVDYAELLRYESNWIVPPLWAGTVHCTPNPTFQGGDFGVYANAGGWEHYRKHGYKARHSGNDSMGGFSMTAYSSTATREPQYDEATGWLCIPYNPGRAILHQGNLPHLSTPVVAATAAADSDISVHSDSLGFRVIVGLNVFGWDVGPTVQRAPEHSPAFHRRVLWYRRCSRLAPKLDLQAISQTQGLRKFLVWAKRQEAKKQFQRAQEELNQQILHFFQSKSRTVTVQELMEALAAQHINLAPKTTRWSLVDIHVHIHHLLQDSSQGPPGRCKKKSLDGKCWMLKRAPTLTPEKETGSTDGLVSPKLIVQIEICDDNQ